MRGSQHVTRTRTWFVRQAATPRLLTVGALTVPRLPVVGVMLVLVKEVTVTQTLESPVDAEKRLPPRCSACAGRLIPTEVEGQLYVRRRGDTSRSAWSATPLEGWTCYDCGRTDLYAAEPQRLGN